MTKIILFVALMCVSSFAFSNISDTAAVYDSTAIRDIQKKLDEMEAKLTLLMTEKSDNNPLSLATTLQWGKGLCFSTQPDLLGVFKINLEASYIIKPRIIRYGLKIGGKKNLLGRKVENNTDNVYAGVVIGTPIFMNFVSLSGFYQFHYYRGEYFYGAINKHFGNTLGADLEIWASSNFCFTLGNSATLFNRKEAIDHDGLIGTYAIHDNANFGVRFFIPTKKK